MLRSQRETLKDLRETAAMLIDRLDAPTRFAREYKDDLGVSVRHGDLLPGQNYTLIEVLNDARRIARRIRSTKFGQHSLVQSSLLNQTLRHLKNIDARVTTISALVTQIQEDARPLQLASGASWVVRETGEAAYNLEEHLVYIADQSESLKAALPSLLTASETRTSVTPEEDDELRLDRADVAKVAADVAKKSKKIDGVISELERERARLLAEVEATLREAQGARSGALEAATATQVARAETDEQRRLVEGQVSAIDTSLALARERAEEAGRVTTSAQANLEIMESLIQKVTASENHTNKILSRLNQSSIDLGLQQRMIDETLDRANDMLSVSTVTGLGASFDTERRSLEKSMGYALIGFAVGIIMLLVTTSALAAYVLELPFTLGSIQISASGATARVGDEVTLAGVISRTVILLAPFWVTLFSARRYNALFDLRQHYSHKYNLAFAVDGFQKQAPQHKELLAALVFQKIMSNPVDAAKSRKMGETPVASMAEFIKPLTDQIELLKKAVEEKR